MEQNISICVCGKKATKYCARCNVQTYCSKICQKKDWKRHKKACRKHALSEHALTEHENSAQIDIFQYVRERINKNWTDKISWYLQKRKEHNNHDFIPFFVATRPVGDFFYENATPKPKYFTLAFYILKDFPRTIFMALSDHDDGIYKRACSKEFICSHELIVYSEDDFPKDVGIKCVMPNHLFKYIYVNWDNGEIYDHDDLENFYPPDISEKKMIQE